MSRIENGILIIEPEKPQQCELCGKIASLRPYGPNGEKICFECGMKNREAAVIAFRNRLKQANYQWTIENLHK